MNRPIQLRLQQCFSTISLEEANGKDRGGKKSFCVRPRWQVRVLAIKDGQAKLKMLANNKETGEPVDINHIIYVPLSSLTVLPEGAIAVKVGIWEAFGNVEIKEERGLALEDIKLFFTAEGRNFTVRCVVGI